MAEKSARTASGFGQFQLNRSHIDVGTDYSKVVPRPKASDMASMLRKGKTIKEIAASMNLSVSTIKHRITEGGWSAVTGEVRGSKR